MVDDTRVAAALSRLPVVGKVDDVAGGNAGGGGGEVGASERSVGVAPRELVDWAPGSGDGVASGTGVLLKSTCRASFGQTLQSKLYKSFDHSPELPPQQCSALVSPPPCSCSAGSRS